MAKTAKPGEIVTASKNGREYRTRAYCTGQGVFEFETLSEAGWIHVHACGSENVYFEWKSDDGEVLQGFCKCL
jgi:hypothetical protein